MRRIKGIITLLVVAAFCSNVFAETKQEGDTDELAYGVSLYNFFQDKYFSAITDILIAKDKSPAKTMGADPELLLGGLYLNYGMHQDANTIFDHLLDEYTTPIIRDRAWFNLAKMQYARGARSEAKSNLLQIQNTLPDYRNEERLNLLANIAIEQESYDAAAELLQSLPDGSIWKGYVQFNLGVTLISQDRADEGHDLLRSMAKIDPVSEEHRSLRDKANLALGFSFLRIEQHSKAAEAFKHVQLAGPQSDAALLGLGWALSRQSLYKQALTPWMELNSRDSYSIAVQESLLAVPYTFELMERPRLALSHYDKAATTLSQQLIELSQVMEAIEHGELLKSLSPATLGDEDSFALFRSELPKSISAPYLQTVMASHEFRVAAKNYQDLIYLDYLLRLWENSLPTLSLMLNERRDLYEQKAPQVVDSHQLRKIEQYQKQRDAFASEIERIVQSNDIIALANDDELEFLEVLDAVKSNLNNLSENQDLTEQREKYKLLRGVLYWQINNEIVPRQWRLKRGLKELDIILMEARNADNSLRKAWTGAPRSFDGFKKRIEGNTKKNEQLRNKIEQLKKQQGININKLALKELKRQNIQLEKYHSRARFSLARLYDVLGKAEKP